MYARDDFERMILNLANGISINTIPSTIYVGLLLGDPGDNGQYTEISYTGYARQAITFTEPTAGTGSHSIQNQSQIVFPESHESAGTVQFIGIFTSANANTGTMLLYGDLDDDIAVTSGVSPTFQEGSIKYTLSGKISSTWRQRILNTLRNTPATGFTPYFGCASGDVESGGTEFSGNGYNRVQIAFTTPANLGSGNSGPMAINNSAAITTPYATAQWGNWSHTVIYDAATGGNPFYLTARSQTNMIYKGGACGYNSGDLVLTID